MREFHCGENKTCQNGLQKTSYGQETLDKAFLILYICRSNYQWIKEKNKNNEESEIDLKIKNLDSFLFLEKEKMEE